MFKDITPLLADGAAFAAVVSAMADGGDGTGGQGSGWAGSSWANRQGGRDRGARLHPGRPGGVLSGRGLRPRPQAGQAARRQPWRESYQLEYGTATVEVHVDAFQPGDRVLIVDDVLATGGTAAASVSLVRRSGAEVAAVSVLLELGFLGGRARLPDVEVRSLLAV